ncbi:MAG: hypothetical protein PVG79_01825 [Gemmatimonadales bacterium]|jgi:hypothetical protein
MHKKRLRICLLISLSLAGIAPPTLSAQEARVDSLEARIRELEAQLDSLMAVLSRGELPDTAAEAAAGELEALRAALQEAAAEQPPPDTAGEQRSRVRNLNVLNPEVSVTGDVVGAYTVPAEGRNRFTVVPQEFEFNFQAALDPYSYTKIMVSYGQAVEIAGYPFPEDGEGDFSVEEGYFYYIGLPIGLKLGKFRQEIGLYNRWHSHALFEVDRPLPTVAFLGGDGLIQTGLSLTLPVVTTGSGTHTTTLEITRSANEALFESAKEIAFLGNFRSFWDLGPSTYVQFGATGVYGENNDTDAPDGPFDASLLAFDFAFRWRPPRQAMYKDFALKAEYYFARREFPGSKLTGDGGYVQANYRLNRRWIAGFRADYLDDYGVGGEFYQLVPSLTWWQTEWVFFRLQYTYLKPEDGDGSHTVLLQTIWSVGPHRHEEY